MISHTRQNFLLAKIFKLLQVELHIFFYKLWLVPQMDGYSIVLIGSDFDS